MSSANITVDPLAQAVCVAEPAIEEMIDRRTGDVVDVGKFIPAHRYDEMIVVRQKVRESLDADPSTRERKLDLPGPVPDIRLQGQDVATNRRISGISPI